MSPISAGSLPRTEFGSSAATQNERSDSAICSSPRRAALRGHVAAGRVAMNYTLYVLGLVAVVGAILSLAARSG
jgi:hypothetical protein